MPNPTYLSADTRSTKTLYCRYCMHALLKGKTEKPCAPEYCPLDLYSGQEIRIRTALSALWSAWSQSNGSVNNLRIFADGEFVLPSSVRWQCLFLYSFGAQRSEQATSLVSLQRELGLSYSTLGDLRQGVIDLITSVLLSSPLLAFLSATQQSLDSLDIEGLRTLWKHSHPSSEFGEDCSEPSIDDWESFLDRYITSRSSTTLLDPRPSDIIYYMMCYALSATFKDASVIIRWNHFGEEPSLTLIDLDVKRISKVGSWYALDRQITDNARCTNFKIVCSNSAHISSP